MRVITVVVLGSKSEAPLRIVSPRLVHQEQVADFVMEIVDAQAQQNVDIKAGS